MSPPVIFLNKLAAARSINGVGYPYQIKADDLDKNFFAATLEIDPKLVEQKTAGNNHSQRRIRIKGGTQIGSIAYWDGNDYVPLNPPGGGLSVLASSGGTPFWLTTEDCS